MSKISLIIDGIRYDAVPAEYFCSCRGCVFNTSKACRLNNLCRYNGEDYIFKESTKSFEV